MKKKYLYIIVAVFLIAGLIFYLNLTSFCLDCEIVNNPSADKVYACEKLLDENCTISTNSIEVRYSDANKDGLKDSKDTFLELCKNYYGKETDDECKTLCGC